LIPICSTILESNGWYTGADQFKLAGTLKCFRRVGFDPSVIRSTTEALEFGC